jgi:hypothetical protein
MLKTLANLLLVAVAAGMIGTTTHAFACGGNGCTPPPPGQNDQAQGNSNNQQAGACGFHNQQSNCQNVPGNQN